MGDSGKAYNWHVYSSSAEDDSFEGNAPPVYTLEMCMTKLDYKQASVFYKDTSKSVVEMTLNLGISNILPESKICDFQFDPCGYSMNSLEGAVISTIHVTPEDGFSYTSFEAMGYNSKDCDLQELVKRVLSCFRPMVFSISVHVSVDNGSSSWTKLVFPKGYICDMTSHEELKRKSSVVYHTYIMATNESPKSTLPLLSWEEEGEENDCLHLTEKEKKLLKCEMQ